MYFPSTLRTKNQWKENQKSTLLFESDRVLVRSRQNFSTPGIKREIIGLLPIGKHFRLSAVGECEKGNAFLWAYILQGKKRLTINYTFLPAEMGCAHTIFQVPYLSEEFPLFIGVLFTKPSIGDVFVLESMELSAVPMIDFAHYIESQSCHDYACLDCNKRECYGACHLCSSKPDSSTGNCSNNTTNNTTNITNNISNNDNCSPSPPPNPNGSTDVQIQNNIFLDSILKRALLPGCGVDYFSDADCEDGEGEDLDSSSAAGASASERDADETASSLFSEPPHDHFTFKEILNSCLEHAQISEIEEAQQEVSHMHDNFSCGEDIDEDITACYFSGLSSPAIVFVNKCRSDSTNENSDKTVDINKSMVEACEREIEQKHENLDSYAQYLNSLINGI